MFKFPVIRCLILPFLDGELPGTLQKLAVRMQLGNLFWLVRVIKAKEILPMLITCVRAAPVTVVYEECLVRIQASLLHSAPRRDSPCGNRADG